MIAAVPWTYWLGAAWFVVDVVVLIALFVGYFIKVGRLERDWKRWRDRYPFLPEK